MGYITWVIAVVLLVLDRATKRPPGARSPYRAVAASLFVPGLGHVYNGELRKAIIVWCGAALFILLLALTDLAFHFWSLILVNIWYVALWAAPAVEARRRAMQLQNYKLKAVNRWYIYVGATMVVAVIAVPVNSALGVIRFKMLMDSMFPGLHAGEVVVGKQVTAETYIGQRGDILFFRKPLDNKTRVIRRVVAFPGETISIRGGVIYIDDTAINAPWAVAIEEAYHNTAEDYAPYTVPDGMLFMLGDNLACAEDSREWGAVPRENIVCAGKFIFESWDRDNKRVRWERLGLIVEGGG